MLPPASHGMWSLAKLHLFRHQHTVTAVSLKLRELCRGRIPTRALGGEKLGRLIDFNSHI